MDLNFKSLEMKLSNFDEEDFIELIKLFMESKDIVEISVRQRVFKGESQYESLIRRIS